MSLPICCRFQRLLVRIIVPVEASCRCSKYHAIKLCEIGKLEQPKDQTNTYQSGQFFLHRVFCYRGVILFPWMASISERDPSKHPEEKNSGSDQNISGKETRSKKHPYYTVLMDSRDSSHIAITEGLIHLGDVGNYKGHYPIKGLDFVAHEDILPYSITEVPPLEHELFDKLFTPDPINAGGYIPKKIFPEWQKKSFPWSCLWKVYKDTTENIRVTVIPFYMGFRKAEESHWWGYFVRLENFGDQRVQLIDRHWRIFSGPSKTIFTFRAPGVNGQNPVLSKTTPAFQYSSHISLQASSGHMWLAIPVKVSDRKLYLKYQQFLDQRSSKEFKEICSDVLMEWPKLYGVLAILSAMGLISTLPRGTYTMEREDQTQFECRIPPFSLESSVEEKITPTEPLIY